MPEFGAKLAGVSKEQIQRAIQIDKTLEQRGLSELRNMFVNGKISMHKLARIVSIAEKDNEEVLVDVVNKLSKSAIETLIRDERRLQNLENASAGEVGKFAV